jgi:tRNA-dihydrouridine synthase
VTLFSAYILQYRLRLLTYPIDTFTHTQIARKGNYGAYLLPDGDLCERLIGTMASQLAVPVTVKIRCLADEQATIALATRLQNAGAQMITVHGRTLRSAKTTNGPANWDIIRKVSH